MDERMMVKPDQVDAMPEELALAWPDGHETFLAYERLRRACPCALCKGEPHLWGQSGPMPGSDKLKDTSFQLTGMERTGHYGIRLTWADGHDTGIYTYAYLRSLCDCPECIAEKSSA